MLKRIDESVSLDDDVFDMTRYFNGSTHAWGVFEDRFGRVKKTFEVEIDGYWKDDVFIMDERFMYSTGVTDRRKWHVETSDEGRKIVARCDDCIGEARGVSDADKVTMRYAIKLKIAGREMVFSFLDRLFRIDERTVLNRATMSKFGVKLGDVTLVFRKN